MFVTVNGARLFFDTVGSSLALTKAHMDQRPALIVLHGGPGFDHSTMRPYFDRFADTHQVIYLDHRGNGRSGGEADTWRLAQWGDDLDAFCEALGIEAPAVYGQSFGGMVAMAYATRHPEKPSKVVLSSTAARMRLEVTYEMMARFGGEHAAGIARKFWSAPTREGANDYLSVCMPLYNPGDNPTMAEGRARAITRYEVMFDFIGGEQRTMNFLPDLARVRCPTLILAGGLDPITPLACAEEMLAALPPGVGCLEVFQAAGHGIYRDEPERAETLIRGFLAEGARP
jgi:proline iminopeptidase